MEFFEDVWDGINVFDNGLDVLEGGQGIYNGIKNAKVMEGLDMADQAEALDTFGEGQIFSKGASDALGTFGTVMDLVSLGKGSYNLTEGIVENDAEAGVEGIHDLMDGGLGIGATLLEGTPAGAVLAAGAAGFALGDMIAPYVFGSEEDSKGTHYEPVQETYEPTSGNEYLDPIIAPLAGAAEWLFGD